MNLLFCRSLLSQFVIIGGKMTLNDFSCNEGLFKLNHYELLCLQHFSKLTTCRVTLLQFWVNVEGPEKKG